MGLGYRAEKEYANILNATRPLFDPEKLAENTRIQLIGDFKETIVQGNTIEEYSNKLSASVSVGGGVGLFRQASVAASTLKATKVRKNSFYTMRRAFIYYRLDLEYKKTPLLPDVKNDIDNMAPDQLFDKYGTHFINSAFIGNRIDFNTYVNKSSFSNSTDFTLGIKASYGAVSGDAAFGTNTEQITKTFSSNSNLQVMGGDPIKGGNVMNGVGNKKQNYDEWFASTKEVNGHTLADFGHQGLLPISSLASTTARAKALETGMEAYLKKNGTPLPKPKVIVKKNSTFVLQSLDGRIVTFPVLKFLWPASSFYYPLVSNETGAAGLFTFIPTSSTELRHGDNVTIRFTESVLKNDKGETEPNADFLNKRFLKIGGIAPMAHYWDENNECNWVIKKVDTNNGSSIFDGEEVYIQHDVTKKYLTFWNVGGTALSVQESQKVNGGSRDEVFIWKIRLATRK
ncbi:MAG: hypothetical protein IPM82_26765 [Saprospiraceae bacterium]|nr:hypothetical protein [Saprospiraceae bacterium]